MSTWEGYDENKAPFLARFMYSISRNFRNWLDALYGQIDYYRTLAETDELTRLPNLRAFNYRFDEEIDRCKRTGSGLWLLKIDLDDLKGLNTKYGHDAVDRGFQNLGTNLSSAVRREDRRASPGLYNVERRKQDRRVGYDGRQDEVFRLHGDELAALLLDTQDCPKEVVQARLMRIYDAMQNTYVVDEHGLPLGKMSGSIGIAVYPRDYKGRDDFLVSADRKLSQAKQADGLRINGN